MHSSASAPSTATGSGSSGVAAHPRSPGAACAAPAAPAGRSARPGARPHPRGTASRCRPSACPLRTVCSQGVARTRCCMAQQLCQRTRGCRRHVVSLQWGRPGGSACAARQAAAAAARVQDGPAGALPEPAACGQGHQRQGRHSGHQDASKRPRVLRHPFACSRRGSRRLRLQGLLGRPGCLRLGCLPGSAQGSALAAKLTARHSAAASLVSACALAAHQAAASRPAGHAAGCPTCCLERPAQQQERRQPGCAGHQPGDGRVREPRCACPARALRALMPGAARDSSGDDLQCKLEIRGQLSNVAPFKLLECQRRRSRWPSCDICCLGCCTPTGPWQRWPLWLPCCRALRRPSGRPPSLVEPPKTGSPSWISARPAGTRSSLRLPGARPGAAGQEPWAGWGCACARALLQAAAAQSHACRGRCRPGRCPRPGSATFMRSAWSPHSRL